MMEWWQTTVVILAGVLTTLNVIEKISGGVKTAKEPAEDLKRRIEDLERKNAEEYKRIFENYDKEIASIKEGNKVTQRALLALLKHSIDGNNIEQLQKAEESLTDYLADK